MGKLLGAHDSEELDRPDLNKCPDCRCFFAGDNCPLCGKKCPEEMRAGNRAKVKPKKKRSTPNSGRVTFVSWYHSWLFIILMMFIMPHKCPGTPKRVTLDNSSKILGITSKNQ